MTRKIKFIIAALFITGLLFLFPSNKAHADDAPVATNTSQPVSDIPIAITDTSTVNAVIDTSTVTVAVVENKINSAISSLQTTSEANGNAIISTIQANVSNTDTSTAISIATTQEPMASAVAEANTKIQIAQQTIDSATVATQVAQTAIAAVDAQTAIVTQSVTIVDSTTVTANNAQTTLTSEVAKLPDLKDTQKTTESGFYTENSNLGTATSNVQIAQDNLTNAVTDLQNNGTITTTTNGVTATVYRATNGAAPSIANPTPILTTTVPNIAFNWGSGVVLNSGLADHVIIKFDGTIAVPSDATAVKYAVYSDDGSKLYVDGTLAISNWRDQGPTWSPYSPTYSVTGGQTQQLTIWYYENGGGAGVTLGWAIFRADGTGYFTTPGSSAFGTSITTIDPVKLAAADAAKANVLSTQSAYDTQLAIRNAAYQAWQDAIHAVDAQQSVIDAAQATYDLAQQNLTTAQQNLTTEQQKLTVAQQNSQSALQSANSLADAAVVAVQDANAATGNAVTVTQDYYAEQARLAAEAEAARQAAIKAEADRQAAIAKAAADKAAADAALAAQQKADAEARAARAQALAEQAAADKAAADAAAAAQQAANEKAAAEAKAAEDARIAAEQAAKEAQAAADKAAEDAKIQAAKDAQAAADAAKAEADAKAKAEQDAALAEQKAKDEADKQKAEADKIAAEQTAKEQQAKDAKAAQDAAIQAQKDAQAKADAAKAEADKAAQQASDKAAADKAAADKALVASTGVVPNNPAQLPTDIPKPAPAEVLVPHIQQDIKGVENGGIQFFGTQSAPQVVGEDGHLTPPAPPPGSGLPIPPDAITTADTFIGQPGGTSFNSPDIAVPVVLTPVTGALAAVPGIEAVNQAFVAMANIGNDMSPVTRKKAKKILVLTIAVAAIRRRFN
jgi:hypothetical protein